MKLTGEERNECGDCGPCLFLDFEETDLDTHCVECNCEYHDEDMEEK